MLTWNRKGSAIKKWVPSHSHWEDALTQNKGQAGRKENGKLNSERLQTEEYLKPIHESQTSIAAKNQMQHSVTKLMLNPLLLRSKWRLSPKGRTLILLVLGESSEMLLSECHAHTQRWLSTQRNKAPVSKNQQEKQARESFRPSTLELPCVDC